MQDPVAVALVGGPAPAVDAGHVSERLRRPGVGAGAVFLGLEYDVDLAAPRDSRFEVGGDLGEGVGGVADQQDSLAGMQ